MEESLNKFKRIATALAVASLIMGNTNVIDRIAYSLTPEQAVRALNDSMRTISSIMSSNQSNVKVEKTTVKSKNGEVTATKVTVEGNQYFVYSALPNEDEVAEFIDALTKDIRIARKVGGMALATYVKALEKGE
jgi:CRISPR type I-A-associated protein Csa5